jgi:hypothetical protein
MIVRELLKAVNWILFQTTSRPNVKYTTCKPFYVGKKYADILVAVNVDPVKLVGGKGNGASSGRFPRNIPDHFFGHEVRQYCGKNCIIPTD